MNCGQPVEIVDSHGGVLARAVYQCSDSFLVINHNPAWDTYDAPFRNGELLFTWRTLLKRLIWLAAHPASSEHPAFSYSARSVGQRYAQVLLDRQMKASDLAALLDVPEDDMRRELHDWIVVPEPEPAQIAEGLPDGNNG